MLSVSSRGRRVQALQGERAGSGDGAERGLALSVPLGAGSGLALPPRPGRQRRAAAPWRELGLGSAPERARDGAEPWREPGMGQHHGQRPARPRPAPPATRSQGVPPRATQCFGLVLLRPHPQHALELGLGALCQFS